MHAHMHTHTPTHTRTTQAALLHDTVEDTDTHPEDLDVFGEEVRGLVMEVSDDKSLPKMERKQLQVWRVLCSNETKLCVFV